MPCSKRLTKQQKQEVTRQMLEESRRLVQQGVPLRVVRQRIADLRHDLVQAAYEGIALTVVSERLHAQEDGI